MFCFVLFFSLNNVLDPTEKQNAEWHAFFEAQIKSLRSFSGSDAIQLLLDSERIYIGKLLNNLVFTY